MNVLIWVARSAGLIMALSYTPQQYRIVKNRSSKDVSLPMFLMVFVALFIYEIYAISIMEPVFLWTNSAGLFQASILLFLIWKYRR